MMTRVQTALNEVRPFLQQDGGDAEIVSVEDGVVTLRLTGHCAGCPMSIQTLKSGIEKHLKSKIPEIREVRQDGEAQRASEMPALAPAAPVFTACPVSNTYTSKYRAEHQAIAAQMKLLSEAMMRISASPAFNREAQRAISQVRSFLANDFAAHMKREEEEFFPALKPLISWGDPIGAMLKEHAELRKQIDTLGEAALAWEFGGPNKLLGTGAALISAMRNHLHREENCIYFEADELLNRPVIAAAGQ